MSGAAVAEEQREARSGVDIMHRSLRLPSSCQLRGLLPVATCCHVCIWRKGEPRQKRHTTRNRWQEHYGKGRAGRAGAWEPERKKGFPRHASGVNRGQGRMAGRPWPANPEGQEAGGQETPGLRGRVRRGCEVAILEVVVWAGGGSNWGPGRNRGPSAREQQVEGRGAEPTFSWLTASEHWR